MFKRIYESFLVLELLLLFNKKAIKANPAPIQRNITIVEENFSNIIDNKPNTNQIVNNNIANATIEVDFICSFLKLKLLCQIQWQ